jgi:hypothetical protein
MSVKDAAGKTTQGSVVIEGLCDADKNGGKPCGTTVVIGGLKITPLTLNPYPTEPVYTIPQASYLLKVQVEQ